jgi:hypothetical protein
MAVDDHVNSYVLYLFDMYEKFQTAEHTHMYDTRGICTVIADFREVA